MVGTAEPMTNISPSDPSYAETYEMLSRLLAQEEKEHGKIVEMSERSLREWLSDFLNRVSKILAESTAKIAAMIADYVQIGRNALTTVKRSYSEAYKKARRIEPI